MSRISVFRIALLSVCLAATGSAQAQDPSDDPWYVVEAQWDAEEKGDNGWIEAMLTEDFAGWGKESPAPRSRRSTAKWDRFTDQQGKMVAHELYLMSITIRDNIAVAHYLYTSAYEDNEGDVEISNGRFTDVLVRTDDGWKFIAWHGGDD